MAIKYLLEGDSPEPQKQVRLSLRRAAASVYLYAEDGKGKGQYIVGLTQDGRLLRSTLDKKAAAALGFVLNTEGKLAQAEEATEGEE